MANTVNKKRITEKTTGTRQILGTDWPIYSYVERVAWLGKVEWEVTFSLCNGVPAKTATYKTRKEALQAFNEW